MAFVWEETCGMVSVVILLSDYFIGMLSVVMADPAVVACCCYQRVSAVVLVV